MTNLERKNTRFVIARNPWSAVFQVKKVREGLIKKERVLHLTRDAALEKRNQMRSIHHAAYQVYEVPFRD